MLAEASVNVEIGGYIYSIHTFPYLSNNNLLYKYTGDRDHTTVRLMPLSIDLCEIKKGINLLAYQI